MDQQELSRRLENLIRIGTVHSVDYGAVRCRVQTGQLVTDWLRWHGGRAGETCEWDPPTVGEQAIVFSPSGELGAGIVLYGINSDAIPAPSSDPDEHVIAYPDGARITYNHASGALSATSIKTALIEASEQTTIDCPENTITGNLLVEGNLHVKGTGLFEQLLTYLAGMAGQGGAGGNTTIQGDIEHTDGALSSNGVVLDTHQHSGVLPGGANTGGPV